MKTMHKCPGHKIK